MSVQIKTPRGTVYTVKQKNGTIVAGIKWGKDFTQRINGNIMNAQEFVDSEVLRRCDPYVPFRTGVLKKSGILGTEIGSGEVSYIAPYARKQYYRNKGNGKRGKLWFERMKQDYKDEIRRGAQKIMVDRSK